MDTWSLWVSVESWELGSGSKGERVSSSFQERSGLFRVSRLGLWGCGSRIGIDGFIG